MNEDDQEKLEDAEDLLDLWTECGKKTCEICWKPAFYDTLKGQPCCPVCYKEDRDDFERQLSSAGKFVDGYFYSPPIPRYTYQNGISRQRPSILNIPLSSTAIRTCDVQ